MTVRVLAMSDTVVPTAPPDGWVRLEGALNFRDLGGYLTRSGEIVRSGRLFRSDSLDELTPRDISFLGNALELQTVVDLRVDRERSPDLTECAPVRRTLPVLELDSAEPVFSPGVALCDVYAHILRTRSDVFRTLLELLAEAEHPLVFHCTAGKDRTGLVAAVVLGTLGVGDSDIVRDYALTQAVLPQLMERVAERLARAGLALPPQAHTAEPETMKALVRSINRDHGSVLGYTLDAGVDVSVVEALRARLLR